MNTGFAVRVLIAALVTVTLITAPAHATIVAEISGGRFVDVQNYDPEGILMTLGNGFTNVSVSANLSSISVNGNGTGTVYLTNSYGPGTTEANEIAHTTVSGLSFGVNNVMLFSGLTLAPNTYYFLLTASNLGGGGLGWGLYLSPMGRGFEPGDFFRDIGANAEAPYPPASDFHRSQSFIFEFALTGDEVVLPEPATLPLAGVALTLGLIVAGRTKAKR